MSTGPGILPQLGSSFLIKIVRIAFEAAFYGVYIILISASTTILTRRGFRSPWKVYVLCITIVMFLGSSLFMAIDIADIVLRLKIILLDDSNIDDLQDRMNEADAKTQTLAWTGEILFVFMLILGDSVVLWRTWAIYYGKRVYTILPFLTWLGSLLAGLYELGCDVKTHWAFLSSTPSASSQGAESCAKSDLSSFTLSYATNLICTCLIFLRAWSFRNSMRKHLGSAKLDTQAGKIMVLLVESGLLYLTIYVITSWPCPYYDSQRP
ncbi:hypothetical protein AX15_000736 [Amanita polypyramis BW_CC]|nr:hypothetical protein AX15_000736 [Amanita polypyramis BW_CC]